MGETLSKCFVDVETLPDDGFGVIQLLGLAAIYGYIVVLAADGIGNGCELLMAYSPSMAALVGPVVLPILGAVPDSMIILFSGMGDDAQEKLNVGVGALAGSTVMLLTIPWFLVILFGRVDLDENGHGSYKSKNKNVNFPGLYPLMSTGINVTGLVPKSGKMMIITALSYLIIQIPAVVLGCGFSDTVCHAGGERYWALAAMILCIIGFVGYIWYCTIVAGSEETAPIWLALYERQIDAGTIDILSVALIVLDKEYQPENNGRSNEDNDGTRFLLAEDSPLRKQMRLLIRRYWNRFDNSRNGKLNVKQFNQFLDAVRVSGEDRFSLTHRVGSSVIDFDHVLEFMFDLIIAKQMISGDERMTDMSKPKTSLYSIAFKICEEEELHDDHDTAIERIQSALKPIFEKHEDETGQICVEGIHKLFPELGLKVGDSRIKIFLAAVDIDEDKKVSTEELAHFLYSTVIHYVKHPGAHDSKKENEGEGKELMSILDSKEETEVEAKKGGINTEEAEEEEETGDEEDEEFDLPQDIASLPKEERQKAILKTSLTMICISTIAVVLVSDPLTDVMSELGSRMEVSPFYVSFVLAPLASNGSELGAAITLAKRKTVAKATAGVSQLLGAGSMNNTMCLGVFLALIYFRNLKWTFTAETISILTAEIVTALIGMKTTQTLFDGFLILSIYPLSIALVALLESVGLQ